LVKLGLDIMLVGFLNWHIFWFS